MGASVVSVVMVAAVTTILPALGLLYYLLNRYEGYFEDARVFFSLTVGFFAGIVVAFLENVAFAFDSASFIAQAGIGTAFVLFLVGNAFVEAAAKTVVLGSGKFRKRKDTPYYGAALGVGFGAMVALQSVALGLNQTSLLDRPFDARWALVLTLILAAGAGTILSAAATGVWVGRGAADGRLWRGLAHGALLTIPTLACLWFFRPAPAVLPAFASLLYGLVLVVVTQRRILDRIVPPEIRDMVAKERRREARRAAAGDAPNEPGGPSAPEPAAEAPPKAP